MDTLCEAETEAEVEKLEPYVRRLVLAARRIAYKYGVSFDIADVGAGSTECQTYDRFKLSTQFCGLGLDLFFIFSGPRLPPDVIVLSFDTGGQGQVRHARFFRCLTKRLLFVEDLRRTPFDL